MSDPLKCCDVAPYTRCNSATKHLDNATFHATNIATVDLLTLSDRVLWRNQCNQSLNLNATSESHMYTAQVSCSVAALKSRNCATEELNTLIRKISGKYGGDNEQFLSEYIADVIFAWSHDFDKVISCFKEIQGT